MRRLFSLILIVAFVTTQAGAAVCAVEPGHGPVSGAATADLEHAHAGGHGSHDATPPTSDHGSHHGEVECRLALTCGTVALPGLAFAAAPVATLPPAAVSSAPELPASVHPTADPPPPRLLV